MDDTSPHHMLVQAGLLIDESRARHYDRKRHKRRPVKDDYHVSLRIPIRATVELRVRKGSSLVEVALRLLKSFPRGRRKIAHGLSDGVGAWEMDVEARPYHDEEFQEGAPVKWSKQEDRVVTAVIRGEAPNVPLWLTAQVLNTVFHEGKQIRKAVSVAKRKSHICKEAKKAWLDQAEKKLNVESP